MTTARPPVPRLRVGTRGSALALRQADLVRSLLQAAHPHLTVAVDVIQSLGDLAPDRPLAAIGAQGIFTGALERALLDGAVDVAVHSAKDLPSRLAGGCDIAASPGREDPRDSLVTHDGCTLADLPAGAHIGTGSPRRVAQLRALRPDLAFAPIRGNVDTRRRAALEGRFDGVILAAAGLRRLGLFDRHVSLLSLEQCLPQAGQGILALETRAEDSATIALLRAIHDLEVGACLQAERAVLAGLAAGCQAPVAAYAEAVDGTLRVRGLVAPAAPRLPLTAAAEGPLGDAERLGRTVAAALLAQGADAWLREAREGQP